MPDSRDDAKKVVQDLSQDGIQVENKEHFIKILTQAIDEYKEYRNTFEGRVLEASVEFILFKMLFQIHEMWIREKRLPKNVDELLGDYTDSDSVVIIGTVLFGYLKDYLNELNEDMK